jgi:hypothetical protein
MVEAMVQTVEGRTRARELRFASGRSYHELVERFTFSYYVP